MTFARALSTLRPVRIRCRCGWPFADLGDLGEHRVDVEKTIAQHVQQLVKNEHIIVAVPHLFNAQRPRFFARLDVLRFVVGVPGKSVAHRMDLDPEFFERFVLAVPVRSGLHELDHAAVHTATGGTHQNADRGGRFALAVAGIEHQQAFGVFAIIVAPPLIAFFFGFGH